MQNIFSNSTPTLMFSGGGTGGHLFPGIAVAEAWQKQHPETRVVFVGTNREVEQRILSQTNYLHESIDFSPPGQLGNNLFKQWTNWSRAKKQARELLEQYRPQVIIGLGGYSSFPMISSAPRQLPVILLEQNAIPGRVNSLLARSSHAICLSYDKAKAHLPQKRSVVTTGNPLRQEILQAGVQNDINSSQNILLVLGGSQGSRNINLAMLNALQSGKINLKRWHVRHQTGDSFQYHERYNQLIDTYREQCISAEVCPFFSSPAELYRGASCAVTRAGGTTLAELDYLRIPSLVVPIPDAIRNHQRHNAKAFLESNRGFMTEESEANFEQKFEESLSQLLVSCRRDPACDSQSYNSAQEEALIVPASEKICSIIQSFLTSTRIPSELE